MKRVFRSHINVLRAAIILIGAGGIIGQLLLIRVLMVVFYGNELTLAVVIAGWLVSEAAGSWAGGRITVFKKALPPAFVALLALYSFVLTAAVIFARTGTGLRIGLVPGEAMGLGRIALTVVLTVAPTGFLHGSLFPLSAHLLGKGGGGVSRAYLIEIVGSIAGGLVFVFLLAPYFTASQVLTVLIPVHLMLVAWIGITSAAFRLRRGFRVPATAIGAIALFLLIFSPVLAHRLHQFSTARQWPEGDLTLYRNSPYGNIAVLEQDGQYTVRYDGRPIMTLPHPDTARIQDYAWLAALAHPNPGKTLVMGGAMGGMIHQLHRHPVEELVYTELDPHLPKVVEELDTELVRKELSDPRTTLIKRDGRLYLNRTDRRFDLIMLGDVDIQTLQTNRFYTLEFFQLARRRLKDGGVVVFSLPGSIRHLDGELAALNACLYHTVGQVFEHVFFLPGDQHNMMMASDVPLALDADTAAQRLKEREIYGDMLTSGYLEFRFDTDRINEFTSILEETPVRLNRDFTPTGFFRGLSYWGRAFAPRATDIFHAMAGAGIYYYLAAAVVLVVVARRWFFTSAAAEANRLTYTIGSSGTAAMSFDIFTLLAFQSLFGHIYQLTGLFIVAFMGGMYIGGRMSYRSLEGRGSKSEEEIYALLLRLDAAIINMLIGFIAVIYAIRGIMGFPAAPLLGAVVAVVYAAAAGGVVGAQFPVATFLMPAPWGDSAGRTAGRLYSADLLGGCMGALIVTLLLFPVLGLALTLILLAVIKISSFILLLPGRSQFLSFSWKKT